MKIVLHKNKKEYEVIKNLTKDLNQVLNTTVNGNKMIMFIAKDSGRPVTYIFDI